MRRQLNPAEIWPDLNPLNKGLVFQRFSKLIPPQVNKTKTNSVHECTLFVFEGRLLSQTRDNALGYFQIDHLGRKHYKERSVKALFWPQNHADIDHLLALPGSTARLRLFNGVFLPVVFTVTSQAVNLVNDRTAIALKLTPANFPAQVYAWFGRLVENLGSHRQHLQSFIQQTHN